MYADEFKVLFAPCMFGRYFCFALECNMGTIKFDESTVEKNGKDADRPRQKIIDIVLASLDMRNENLWNFPCVSRSFFRRSIN